MMNFVGYSDGNKRSGSQFELHTNSHLVVVNTNSKYYFLEFFC